MGVALCITPAVPASIAGASWAGSEMALRTSAAARGRRRRKSLMNSVPEPSGRSRPNTRHVHFQIVVLEDRSSLGERSRLGDHGHIGLEPEHKGERLAEGG